MQFGTIEQLIRIGLNAAGMYALGDGVANGELYQAAIGGVVSVAAFAWWYFRNREVQAATPGA